MIIKKIYESPEIAILTSCCNDVITTSPAIADDKTDGLDNVFNLNGGNL